MFGITSKKTIWDISERDFPAAGEREKMRFLLRYAIPAPSSHNTQPWKFRIVGDETIEIYADNARWLKVADAGKRELYPSVGCALENLLIAAGHFGYQTEVDYFPHSANEEFVACVGLQPSRKSFETPRTQLFEFITGRSTYHGTFVNAPVSEPILRVVHACAEEKGINLYLTADDEITVASLAAIGFLLGNMKSAKGENL